MTDYKGLCRELVWLDQAEPGDYADWRQAWNAAIKRARAALAEPEPEGPTDEPIIPDHYRGDDIRIYREGFHAGYKYAFQLMEKCSDSSAQPS